MHFFKKLLAFTLVLLLLLAVGCDAKKSKKSRYDDDDDEDDTYSESSQSDMSSVSGDESFVVDQSSPDSENSSEGENNTATPHPIFGNIPQQDFRDDTITILVEGSDMGIYSPSEICASEEMPEILYDNILERNDCVEKFLNVNIQEARVGVGESMYQLVSNSVAAGLDDYDIVMPYVNNAAELASDGLLRDLNGYIDLDAPFWDQNATEDLSINNQNYFLIGDVNLLSLACTHIIIFNKELISSYGLESPYDLVKSGDWTIDKMREMASVVTCEIDGDGQMTHRDKWGFLVNQNFVTSMYLGSGNRITGKDINDRPFIEIFNQVNSANAVFKKISEFVNDQTACAKVDGDGPYMNSALADNVSPWDAATHSIASGNALFRSASVIDIIDHGNYDCNFGIVPIPKFSKSQDKYYSNVSLLYVTTMAMPISVRDTERAALVMQAMNAASTGTTRYAYEEILLKRREIQDYQSEEMLDIIFDGRVYDLSLVYHWGGHAYDGNSVGTFMDILAYSGNTSMIQKIQSIKTLVNEQLNETVDRFKR